MSLVAWKKNLLIFFLCTIMSAQAEIQEKIKMYVFYTPSHEVLFERWFLPSIQDDFELVIERYDQQCQSATFKQQGWHETMLKKVDLIIRGVKENWGRWFIHADVDIQFLAPIYKEIIPLLGDNDMLVQWLDSCNIACPGFLVCKGNASTLELWTEIKKRMIDDPRKNDQDYLNDIIQAKGYSKIKWAPLPIEFFAAGALEACEWKPGIDLKLPSKVLLHHATWTTGISNKIAQLGYVRNKVNKVLQGR